MDAQVESALITRELGALLDFLRRNGCVFCPCLELGTTPRGAAFRYDIHRRDLPAAHGFLELHLRENVPATFFLLWDYSPLERSRLQAFRDFAAKVRAPVELGLHDSPVDAYLIKSKFQNDRKAYVSWTRLDESIQWFTALYRAPTELSALNARVFEDFTARVEQTKNLFGPVSTIASHGGQIGQMLTKGGLAVTPEVAALLETLAARGWLTPERVAAAGLISDVESFRTSGKNNTQVSDTGGKLSAFVRHLRRSLAERYAIQLLLHPFTWAGAERDAELSELLKEL